MPIPKPNSDESEESFVSRCMSNSTMMQEYSDEDQRLAVCYSSWREKSMADNNNSLLNAVRVRQKKQTEFGYGIWTADRFVRTLAEQVGLESCYKRISSKTISYNDILTKAAETLVYSNPDMVVQEKQVIESQPSLELPDGIELPKNTLMVFKHVLTSSRKDRDGDVLHSEGMMVDPGMLLLWQHVPTLPIGKFLAIHQQNEKNLEVYSCIVDMNDLCHDAAVMVDNKMGRFSHGFRAIEFQKLKAEEGVESGFEVIKAEIMEESLVSVPANIDAETQEVILSLVEGGKLTSGIMKDYGNVIKEHRPISMPVKLDLKVTVNGQELKNHEERPNERSDDGKTEVGQKDGLSTSKETDGETERKDGEGSTSDKEVKMTEVKGYGFIEGSWEETTCKLRDAASKKLVQNKDQEWLYIEATFSNRIIVCHMSYIDDERSEKYVQLEWEMQDGKPVLTGEAKEVEVITNIREKSFSKRLELNVWSNDEEGKPKWVAQLLSDSEDSATSEGTDKTGEEVSIQKAVETILAKADMAYINKLHEVLSAMKNVEEKKINARKFFSFRQKSRS